MKSAKSGYKLVNTIFHKTEEIPNDWEFEKISDLGEIVGGGTPDTKKEQYWKNGTVQWYTPQELTNLKSNFVDESERKITQEGMKNSSAKELPEGALLITTRATIGNCAISQSKVTTNQGFQNLICNKNIDNNFIMHSIRYNKNRLMQFAQGTTFLEINKSNFSKVKIPNPQNPDESKKIGIILSNMDIFIQKQQEIIEKNKNLKKGLMQKLFSEGLEDSKLETVQGNPRYIKLKIPEHWDLPCLGDVCDTVSGGTPLTSNPDYYDGKILWLTTSELKDNYLSDTKYKISELGLKHSSAKIIPVNSTIIAMYGATIGKTGINAVEMATNQACCIFIPKKKKSVDPFFLQQILIYFRPLIVSLAEGGGQPNISQNFLQKFKIPFPSYPEQDKIASILRNIDSVIQLQEKYTIKIIQIKKGLDQRLLTGQLRVNI